MSLKKTVKFSLALFLLLPTLSGGNANAACEYECAAVEEYYEYIEIIEPPLSSRQTRTFENTSVGFSFEFLESYRAMGSNGGRTIAILDPSSYALTQCIVQNGYGTEYPLASALIDIRQVASIPYNNLHNLIYDSVIANYPHMRNEGRNFWNATYAGNPAVAYSQIDLVYDTTINYVSFLSLDRKHLVTISGPYNSSEMIQILRSFRFYQ